MKAIKKTNQKRVRRINRVRATIIGTAERPRLTVHRTNRFMYAQLIDDTAGRTIAAAHSAPAKGAVKAKMKKSDAAFAVGEALAKKAAEKKIAAAVFDRRSYKFHGRVKSVAEGAKKGGLNI